MNASSALDQLTREHFLARHENATIPNLNYLQLVSFFFSFFPNTLSPAILLNSIGSLGKDNSTGIVTKVVLDTAFLRETTNGLRIKTWQVIL